jgi:hypothetical protein
VRRYSDETAVNNDSLQVKGRVADVVKEAGATTPQTLIATLKQGTNVTAISSTTAQGKLYSLVTFDDPADPGLTLEGWVNHDSFGPTTVDAGTTHKRTCGGGTIAIVTSVSDACVIPCQPAGSCPPGQVCTGAGFAENDDGSPGAAVSFCRLAPPPIDAGTPPPVDASVPTAVDASILATIDASVLTTIDASLPPLKLPTVIRALPGAGCTARYQREGIICRLKCTQDSDCSFTPNSHCQSGLCNP